MQVSNREMFDQAFQRQAIPSFTKFMHAALLGDTIQVGESTELFQPSNIQVPGMYGS